MQLEGTLEADKMRSPCEAQFANQTAKTNGAGIAVFEGFDVLRGPVGTYDFKVHGTSDFNKARFGESYE